ncbi:flagellar basal body-associated FliL family protein [Defluviitalea phaphyphila]|uniref:flagellar basal body-associated FliL family protein n=1 Tax=Defluviitalea phaphyphila TaxID=1473580 RepID=UPI00072FEE2F|nr:flagellar basal body-associated FliL family protein [Defluviitalea phaphyphila]
MEKNKTLIFIIIGVLSITVIVMATTLFSTLNSLKEATENKKNLTFEEVSIDTEDISIFSISDPITANLLNNEEDDTQHILRISVGLGLDSKQKDFKEVNNELTEKTTIIRDIIIKTIRNKTYEEMQKANAQELIGDEILSNIKQEFQTNTIVDIYFEEFFVQ